MRPWPVVALLILAPACSNMRAPRTEVAEAPADRVRASAQAPPAAGAEAGPSESALQAAFGARKLVRTGSLRVEVKDAAAAMRSIEQVAASHGGYVSGLEGSRTGGARTASVTIRVEPRQFMQALAELRALGDVEAEAVTTQDVGREYADLEARLRTKRAAAERMQQLMKERASELGEVLAADQQLTGVLEQIEQLEGQRRCYDQQVALSAITATVHERETPVTVAVTRMPFLDPARRALVTAREHLATVVGAAVYVIAVAGPWTALVALAWILGRRLRARRAGVATP